MRMPKQSRALDEEFDQSDLRENIKGKTVRGGIFMIAGSVVQLCVSLIGNWLLTRELTKADYGLIGMVTILTGFIGLFSNLGITQAVVQTQRLTKGQLSTLFWFGTVIGLLVALINLALAPGLVWFFNEPRLFGISAFYSLFLMIGALTFQHRAILQRQMRFAELSTISVISNLAGVSAAVWAVFNNFSYWSLVILNGVTQLCLLAGLWSMTRWIPGAPRRGTGARKLVSFGMNLSAAQMVNYFAKNIDNLLLGKFWGVAVLGLYSRSYSLMTMPSAKINQPILGVIISSLSKINNQPERYRRLLLSYVSLVSLTVCPIVIGIVLIVDIAVPFLFGDKWIDLVYIFYALSPACLMTATNTTGWFYTSYGHVDRRFKWSLMVVPILLIAMICGLPWGAIGVAIAVSSFYVIFKPLSIIFACVGTPLKPRDFLEPIGGPILITVFPGILALFTSFLFEFDPVYVILFRVLIYAGGILTLLFFTSLGRRILEQFKMTLKQLFDRKRSRKTQAG